jgi:UDP-2,4-diacetamido-2,4,6-trideoxy-beta-L-altropyranose hydrolase
VGIGTLLIRADASAAIGTGHVMRCIGLAQAWQDAGGRAVFAMAESTKAIQTRVSDESCETLAVSGPIASARDLQQTVSFARHQNCEWIVVDGYGIGAEYQKGLTTAGLKVLFLDDYGHSKHYHANVVLNQNLSASPALYSNREPQTRLLLGTQYALLRREFNVWRDLERKISASCRRVLVTMGGSDDGNVTATVIEGLSLAGMAELEVTVLVGGSNPHRKKLQDMVARSPVKMQLLEDVSNVGKLMAEADIAISAAGTTCWELCLLGLPSMLIDIADNQTAVAKELHKRGCAIHIGSRIAPETVAEKMKWLCDASEVRQSLSRSARRLVDGRGATRVVSVLRGERSLQLRPAEEKDRRLLWEWANDPQVRNASFSSALIPWEQHDLWFTTKLKDPDCRILIAEDCQGRAVGQFRVDWNHDGEGEIDVSVSPASRKTGYGTMLIRLGVNRAFAERGERLHAFVKTENHASRHAFEGAGFRSAGEESIQGHRAVHYIHTRNRDQA